MKKFELIVPCHFGMEAVLKREIILWSLILLILYFKSEKGRYGK